MRREIVYIRTHRSYYFLFTYVIFALFTFVNMKTAEEFFSHYSSFKVKEVSGRFLSRPELLRGLENIKKEFDVDEIGRSFLNVPIESIKAGSGPVRILAWSQMHGNETTTTKGVLDLLNLLISYKEHPEVQNILNSCTLLIIPMLNPDGAARYTRENVNGVDLNRDAQDLEEPESKVLRKCFEDFEPHFCFNLHDQRTIFGAGESGKPATISFLAPSMEETCKITQVRVKAMQVIIGMNKALQKVIPGQVGRFDDAFNINCTGDFFQTREVPTILFECGHFPQDYLREKTREFFTFSMLTALKEISSGPYLQENVEEYFEIPENQKNFYDIILRNGVVAGENVDIAIQYSEIIKAGEINFIPRVKTMANGLSSFGHREIQCEGGVIENLEGEPLSENDIVEMILLNKEKLSIKMPLFQ